MMVKSVWRTKILGLKILHFSKTQRNFLYWLQFMQIIHHFTFSRFFMKCAHRVEKILLVLSLDSSYDAPMAVLETDDFCRILVLLHPMKTPPIGRIGVHCLWAQ